MESDYKALYLHLMHEIEHAMNILINAQQECEDAILDTEADTAPKE